MKVSRASLFRVGGLSALLMSTVLIYYSYDSPLLRQRCVPLEGYLLPTIADGFPPSRIVVLQRGDFRDQPTIRGVVASLDTFRTRPSDVEIRIARDCKIQDLITLNDILSEEGLRLAHSNRRFLLTRQAVPVEQNADEGYWQQRSYAIYKGDSPFVESRTYLRTHYGYVLKACQENPQYYGVFAGWVILAVVGFYKARHGALTRQLS